MKDPIADALNLTPVVQATTPLTQKPDRPVTVQPESSSSNEQVENDFEYARKNMYDIIEQGHEAIVKLMDIADQSQHPRAYEVVANLIKTMAETNKDLLNLTKQKRDLTGQDERKPDNVTNNLFVGSTAELQAMLQKKSEEPKQ